MKTRTPAEPLYFIPEPLDNHRLAHLCGPMDENLRQISAALDVTLFRRGDRFIIGGSNGARALTLLEKFYALADKVVSIEDVQLALVEQRSGMAYAETPAASLKPVRGAARRKAIEAVVEDVEAAQIDGPILKTRRHDLRGRTPHQLEYLNAILEHDVTFGVGPAGTGKTYLAVACAVDALERDAVKRIVLTRPAVEAGERLGFLPGDLAQKIDPYLRPLYDALYDLLGFDRTQKMFEKQTIEIAPLAYMRGRTLNHAFVILDEAQNTTSEQMKMFLTRIGFGSKAVITGDVTQIDLQRSQKSGLVDAIEVLDNVRGIAFTRFSSADVVRHPLVARIVDAYEAASAPPPTKPARAATVRNAGKNKLALAVQYADPRLASLLTRPLLRRWVRAALVAPAELTLRFVDSAEGRALNRDYRRKDYATNVLTFAYDDEVPLSDPAHATTRADIVLCSDVLQSEAVAQGKTLLAHTAHLVVHGVLHAQGYDHETEAEADEMESLEIEILAKLGLANPYLAENH